MEVVMDIVGGTLEGHHEFTDNDDMIPRVRHTHKVSPGTTLPLAMLVYHFTNGEVGQSTKGIGVAVFEQAMQAKVTDDDKAAGLEYQIISREQNPVTNTVTLVAECVLG